MTTRPDDVVAMSSFGAGAPGFGVEFARTAIAYAEQQLGRVQPVAVLELEPSQARPVMVEGNQPEDVIAEIERQLAAHPDWSFYECRFWARRAAALASQRAYEAGPGGRRRQ